ncbi:heme NO-binding domain-containing protein [Marinobacter hydrocarbonoclasticus]|nr:heme NO-binding domain-containing protein [Marinobacter nauticus]
MKGMIFTELMDMVDDRFGMETTEAVLRDARLPSGGAYTRVGDYPHEEILELVRTLSQHLGVPERELMVAYGEHLFSRLLTMYPASLESCQNVFDFLMHLEYEIHRQVKKLYDNANPPTFDFGSRTHDRMVMTYHSHRPLGPVAEGLIIGCIRHFDEPLTLTSEALNEQETEVRFVLERDA